jgi:epoxyqueuosine reductase
VQAYHLQEIAEILSTCGLKVVGITDASTLEQDRNALMQWQAQGFAAGMEYMKRDPALLADPRALLPHAQTVISLALDYGAEPAPPPRHGYGRVARYAWGRDYHLVFKEALALLAEKLTQFGTVRFFADAVPLLERALAARTSGAFIGKNTLAIVPKVGSFFFLAELLCDFEIILPTDRSPLVPRQMKACGSCTQCMTQCPTGALVAPYSLDARRCISYLTIEHRGAFTEAQATWIGDWIFGCDICQDVCPYNFVSLKKKRPAHALLQWLDTNRPRFQQLCLEEVLALKTNRDFEQFFEGSPILRARRAGLQRNARAVMKNQSLAGSSIVP